MNIFKNLQKKWHNFWNKEIEGGFEININLDIDQVIFILILMIGLLWIILK